MKMSSNIPMTSPLTNRSFFSPWLFMNVQRQFSTSPYERELVDKLLQAPELMNPTQVVVEDRSGGCGANFYIMVESKVFQGMPRIKQHRTVQLILKDEIAKWHAVSIDTKVPDRK